MPLFKKYDQHILENYRPVSLLTVVFKVFEKVVFDQLYQYVTDNNLIFTSQKLYSTAFASIELVDRVFQHLDKGNLLLSIISVLRKAFDTLDHNILWNKLKFHGLCSTPLKWFASYWHGRKQYVDFDGIHSNTAYIGTGVPQGSILGPLLFINCMNDIHIASQNVNIILYADDTNLISPLCSFNSSLHINKECIGHVSIKSIPNLVIYKNGWISTSYHWMLKKKFMIFHHYQRHINNITPRLRINSETTEKVSEFYFLGLTIDEYLSWKPHVLKISNKIARTLGIMCRLKNFLPMNVLRILYNSSILPHPQYSILAWGFRMGPLDKLQKRAVCIITRSKYNCHTDPLFRKLNLLKAKDLFELNVLKLFYKYKKNSLPFCLSNMFSDFTSSHGYELRTTYIL